MMEVIPNFEDLKASGCTKEQIRKFSACNNTTEKIKFLERHREKLLRSIHKQEQQISTLDYLTHRMKKFEE